MKQQRISEKIPEERPFKWDFRYIFTTVSLLIFLFLQFGCLFEKNMPIGTETAQTLPPKAVGTADSVQFNYLVPKWAKANPPVSSIRTSTASSSTVMATFRLIVVNVDNATNPYTIISQTVPVATDGTGQVKFNSVPAQTCIGDVHVEGGNLWGFSDYHGAIDLKSGQVNIVNVAPRESQMQDDVSAYVVEKVTNSTHLYSKVITGLSSSVASTVEKLNLDAPTIYEDAVTAFVNKSIKPVESTDIVFGPNTVVIDDDSLNTLTQIGNNGMAFTFTNPSSLLKSISAGKIIMAGANEIASSGILRKVSTISADGESLVIKTTDATIEEAISDCSIEYYGNLKTKPILLRKTIRPFVIEGETGGEIVFNQSFPLNGLTLETDFNIKNKFYFKLEIKNFQIKELVSTFDVSENAKLILSSNAALHLSEKYETPSTLLAILELPGPIVIPVFWSLVFQANGEANIGLRLGVEQAMKASIGARRINGNWEMEKSFENKFTPVVELNPAANFSFSFGPKFDARVFGFAGPTLAIKANGYFDLYPSQKISANLSAQLSAKLQVSSLLKLEKEFSPVETERIVLWEKKDAGSSISKVSVKTPPNNSLFTAGSDIQINAKASSNGGTITKIEFLQNGVKIKDDAEDITYPYSYTWQNVPAGNYVLSAKAYDNLGASLVSANIDNVNITVEAPKVLELEPKILDISPKPVPAVGKSTLTISGQNFKDGVYVRLRKPNFNKDDYLAATFVNASQLTFEGDFGNDPSNWTVQVYQGYNSDQKKSDQFSFETVEPQISQTDGFDYPIGQETFYTEADDGDGWRNDQNFGEYYSVNGKYHLGEDWNAETGGDTDLGSPVYAAAAGKVIIAGSVKTSGWGNVVIIRHELPDGRGRYETLYGHLQSVYKSPGDNVSRREQIGTIGKASQSGPAHLHFELRASNCPNWGSEGNGYSSSPKPAGWTDPSEFIDSNRPAGAVIQTPTNVAVTPGIGKNTISWSSVSGANSYNLYYSTSSGVSKTNGTKISGVSSPYSHSGLSNGITYYYVVTAVSISGTESFSSPQKSGSPVGYSAVPPIISSPGTVTEAKYQISNLTPTFTWVAVPGAQKYAIYISQKPWGPLYTFYPNTELTGTSFTIPTGALDYGLNCRWKMTSFVGGVESAPSEALYFLTPGGTPKGKSPGTNLDTGYTVSTLTPMLSWEAVPGALSYRVYVSEDPYVGNVKFQDESVPGTATSLRIPLGYLTKKKKYRWNMVSVTNGVVSDYSERLYFKTQ